MRNRFRGFTGILYKEFLQLFRDPALLFFTFFPPFVQFIAFGYALDFDVRHIRTAVHDQDLTRESRALVDALEATGNFHVVEHVGSLRALEAAVVAGRVRVGFQIPPDYTERLVRGAGAQILVVIDGSDSTFANTALNTANQLGLSLNHRLLERRLPLGTSLRGVEMRPRLLFNPDLKSEWFFVPGVIGLALHLVTVSLTSFAVVRERERGTLEQLLVTPMTKLGLMMGKLIPSFLFVSVEFLVMLAVMRLLFGVPVSGSLWVLMLGSVVYLFAALSIGLMISTAARNQLQAVQMTLATMLPSVFFSGTIAPIETMPWIFQVLSKIIPLTYYVRIIRGVTLRGAPLGDMLPNVLILAAMGLLLIAVAARRFRQTMV